MPGIFKITLFFLFVTASVNGNSQEYSTYSIIVAGHAYGAHSGGSIGLHPPFMAKLAQNVDSVHKFIFLTGDIVNQSNSESWRQVENELSEIKVNSCYVMGNHDNNSIGHQIFEQKHGGSYYSFTFRNELYIVLNSTESDRSISALQLSFLNQTLKDATLSQKRVFIFFHEVIWNSIEKYRMVRSNSRSRYDQMKDHSNFWEEVYPMLTEYAEKEFYLFAGDVGGNPDAVAASYDKWENVTILSSGMGEVADENYMKVDVLSDTIKFTLIPLNNSVEMHPVSWYNVPKSPVKIEGSEKITPPEFEIKYKAEPVFNATSYNWNFSNGIYGQSDSSSIILDFDASYKSGEISVRAVNDGFGESEPLILEIKADENTLVDENNLNTSFKVLQTSESIQINYQSDRKEKAQLRIYNTTGNLLYFDEIYLKPGINSNAINKSSIQEGIVIYELISGSEKYTQKGTIRF